ncbi:MAG TPA: glutaredoxin domain-containing protein [Candidatus Paceibacterota bacterium]|jgi:glutaredoxin 3|nr:glutaredoxin 3 [Patescibacteria group bacterium]
MSKKVEIYSTPTCHFCHMAKDFFNDNGVEFTDYNVATDAVRRSEVVERSGQMGVPVIFIDDQMVIGFDEDKLRELLGL